MTNDINNRRNAVKTTTRIRKALAALALATAVAAPVTLAATATPASAGCGSCLGNNHNEDAALDAGR